MSDDVWRAMLRVRAWFLIFAVAEAASNQHSLAELRQLMLDALQALDEAVKVGEL